MSRVLKLYDKSYTFLDKSVTFVPRVSTFVDNSITASGDILYDKSYRFFDKSVKVDPKLNILLLTSIIKVSKYNFVTGSVAATGVPIVNGKELAVAPVAPVAPVAVEIDILPDGATTIDPRTTEGFGMNINYIYIIYIIDVFLRY